MGATEIVAQIKTRLQAQHTGIWAASGGDVDEQVRLSYRAEMDALWAAVEVVAQLLDGRADVQVRDYFAEGS